MAKKYRRASGKKPNLQKARSAPKRERANLYVQRIHGAQRNITSMFQTVRSKKNTRRHNAKVSMLKKLDRSSELKRPKSLLIKPDKQAARKVKRQADLAMRVLRMRDKSMISYGSSLKRVAGGKGAIKGNRRRNATAGPAWTKDTVSTSIRGRRYKRDSKGRFV